MSSSGRFTRRPEDFTCLACGSRVTGNGYTNHCPACLWSRHVDNFPGDRAATCRGLMEPMGAELDHGAWVVIHRCTECGAIKRNRAAPEDDREVLLPLLQPGRS